MSELSENSMGSNWQPCLMTALVRHAKYWREYQLSTDEKNRRFLVVPEAYRNDFFFSVKKIQKSTDFFFSKFQVKVMLPFLCN